jgi:hypothetical protein
MCYEHGSSNCEIYRTPDESPPPHPFQSQVCIIWRQQATSLKTSHLSLCLPIQYTSFRQLPSQDFTFIILLHLPILLEEMYRYTSIDCQIRCFL